MEITVSQQDEVHTLQQKLSQYNRRTCLVVLDAVMTELCPDNEYILLDKLEINLGNITEGELEGISGTGKLYQLIKSGLAAKIQRAGNSSSIRFINSSNKATEQWLFYMIHGYLDWSAVKTDERWYERVIEGLAVDFTLVSKLCNLIKTNAGAVRRIAVQHSESFLARLAEVITASNQSLLPSAVDEVGKILHHLFNTERKDIHVNIQQFKAVVWAEVLKLASARQDNNTVALVRRLILKFVPVSVITDMIVELEATTADALPVLKSVLEALSTEKKLSGSPDIILPGTKQSHYIIENQKEAPGTDVRIPAQSATDSNDQEPDYITYAGLAPIQQPVPVAPQIEKLRQEIGEQGAFIVHAGLVLLHPFLKYYFRHTGFTSEDKFTDRDKMEKAVFLLHWLATGRASGEEYEFFVPKILIGWPIEEPLEKELELTAEEIAEAVRMIVTVISEWSILKNTSIDGLREGFLRRPGKFYIQHDDYYLHIEKQGIDVLLSHLPWSLGVIKLPWLNALIRVIWV